MSIDMEKGQSDLEISQQNEIEVIDENIERVGNAQINFNKS